MDHLAQDLLDFIMAHRDWAVVVMFITAFGESFAFLSLLFPGTTLLIAAGALIKTGTLPYAPLMIGAIVGAVLGDAVSYWLGRRFGGALAGVWPFTRNPSLLPNGIRFFERHGGKSVFIGRFFGPIRAVVPLTAGIMRMPPAASVRQRHFGAGLGADAAVRRRPARPCRRTAVRVGEHGAAGLRRVDRCSGSSRRCGRRCAPPARSRSRARC